MHSRRNNRNIKPNDSLIITATEHPHGAMKVTAAYTPITYFKLCVGLEEHGMDGQSCCFVLQNRRRSVCGAMCVFCAVLLLPLVIFITAEKGGVAGGEKEKVTLVTLVSHLQLRWRGVTQGGVGPVFPFRASILVLRR